MTRFVFARGLLALVATSLLVSCATQPPADQALTGARQAAFHARVETISEIPVWALDGKLAISDGEDGGSGRLQWRSAFETSRLDFRGALGRGAWQMEIMPGRAVLKLASGETWEAPDVTSLVVQHVGWRVPVDALAWWVRGLEAPGVVQQRILDDEGRMTLLKQHGWEVEYQRYGEFAGMAMPTRLEARNGERHVRLVLRGWTLEGVPEHGS